MVPWAIDEEKDNRKYLRRYNPSSYLGGYRKALSDARKLLYDLYQKMLCQKPKDWKYEEEIRLILHTDASDRQGESYPYSKEAIKSIIIGEKSSSANIEKIKVILTHLGLNIPIKRAVRCRDKYEVQTH